MKYTMFSLIVQDGKSGTVARLLSIDCDRGASALFSIGITDKDAIDDVELFKEIISMCSCASGTLRSHS